MKRVLAPVGVRGAHRERVPAARPFTVAGGEPRLRDVYAVMTQPLAAGSLSGFVGRYSVPQEHLRWTLPSPLFDSGSASIEAPLPERAADARDLPRRWARARVDDLLRRIEAEGERREWIEEIIALSKRYKFVTPYTAFLAAPRSLLRPRRIQPGDPVLRVECDPGTVSAVAFFPFGLRLPLERRSGTELWEGRFLVPEGLADGRYTVRIVLRDTSGASVAESKSFVLDGRAPTVTPDPCRPAHGGETLRVAVRTDEDVLFVTARVGDAPPVSLRWDAALKRSVGPAPRSRGRAGTPGGLLRGRRRGQEPRLRPRDAGGAAHERGAVWPAPRPPAGRRRHRRRKGRPVVGRHDRGRLDLRAWPRACRSWTADRSTTRRRRRSSPTVLEATHASRRPFAIWRRRAASWEIGPGPWRRSRGGPRREGPEAWGEAARWGYEFHEWSSRVPRRGEGAAGPAREARRALADDRVRWADAHPEAADPLALRQARAALFPEDPRALEDWVRALENAGRLDDAEAALSASHALTAERRLLLRSDLQADHGNDRRALEILDEAMGGETSWGQPVGPGLCAACRAGRSAVSPRPGARRSSARFDAAALVRLATYFQGQGRGDAAADLLRQVERRYEAALDRRGWLLLERLHARDRRRPRSLPRPSRRRAARRRWRSHRRPRLPSRASPSAPVAAPWPGGPTTTSRIAGSRASTARRASGPAACRSS